MLGFLSLMREQDRLSELKKEFTTAEDIGVNRCIKCGYCCYRRTCIPTPDELGKIAKFLKLTVKKTIQNYFCVDSYDRTYVVKPAGENIIDLLGKHIPHDRTFNEGKCIFLEDNNNCKIYPVRPESAKVIGCWISDKSDFNPVPLWKKKPLEKIYEFEGGI